MPPLKRPALPAARAPAAPPKAAAPKAAAPKAAATARQVARPASGAGVPANFHYQPDDDEAINRQATDKGGSFDSYTKQIGGNFKPSATNRIRIMPSTFDAEKLKIKRTWYYEIFVHYSVGPDRGTYLCPMKMGLGKCAICEARMEADEEEQKALAPKKRFLVWLIDRADEAAGPKLWSMPGKVCTDIANQQRDARTGKAIGITNPEAGYDIAFNKTGEGVQVQYPGVAVDRSPSPITDDAEKMAKWLTFIQKNPLNLMTHFHEQEYVMGLLTGTAQAHDPDLDETAQGGVRDAEDPPFDTDGQQVEEVQAEEASGFPSPDDIRQMDQDQLQELGTGNEVPGYDVGAYGDLGEAQEGLIYWLAENTGAWPGYEYAPPEEEAAAAEAEREEFEGTAAPPAPPRAAPKVAKPTAPPQAGKPAAGKAAAGKSPVQTAQERLRSLRPTGK
jgi:hypothetical protein